MLLEAFLMEFNDFGAQFGSILQILQKIESDLQTEDGEQITFPKVAVIGDQSHGKSSLLMSICQVSLPTAVGRATTAPAIITMRKKDIDWQGRAYRHGHETDLRTIDTQTAAAEVIEALQIAQNTNGAITSEPIRVQIEGRDVENLTIVDLPGFYRNGPEPEEVRKLISRYIDDENTIVLLVLDVNQQGNANVHEDIRAMLAERDENFKDRCVFTFTRVNDCLTDGIFPPELRRIADDNLYGSRGWFATMAIPHMIFDAPSFQEGIIQQRQYERENFPSIDYYNNDEMQKQCGVENLSKCLARCVYHLLKKCSSDILFSLLKTKLVGKLPSYIQLIENAHSRCSKVLKSMANVENSPIAFGNIIHVRSFITLLFKITLTQYRSWKINIKKLEREGMI